MGKPNISDLETYKTINVIALALLVAYFINNHILFLVISAVLLFNNLAFIRINKVISDYWLAFSRVMGSINSKIILSVIFYLFLTPIAFLYRIFNESKVRKFKLNTEDSYFEDATGVFDKASFKRQW